ncbi:hypothetical protein AMAG_07119 [Allomyces macrogynus ATCC 38327]|uniref:t-SNARE coiled-coil homology domain-containing protein n=1 Tax=Allomyces macrogynus (strain ATCC 38327) TaxID=578462 RepID=A0A0L0SH55_ALLM3|nr:hypothetical protein AMAG_07119 [Allomyces macrogynus ATCC 38327]|eukprot:KNE61843.1 hypothetical protein AMAG_07119 [Allomyces macrogynus ATCC 38327]
MSYNSGYPAPRARSRSRGPAEDRYYGGAPSPSSAQPPRADSGYMDPNARGRGYGDQGGRGGYQGGQGGYGSQGGYQSQYQGGYQSQYQGSSSYATSSSSSAVAQRGQYYPPAPADARAELFQGSGYDPRAGGGRGGPAPPPAGAPAPGEYERRHHPQEAEGVFYSAEDEERAYQDTYAEIQQVKGESVQTSRSALRKIRETEEVAASSMRRLQEQNDKLTHVEERMTQAEYHAHKAENKTQDLQKLNKNFILSTFSFSNPFTRSKRKEEKLRKELEAKNKLAAEKEALRKENQAQQRNLETSLNDAEGKHTPGHYPGASSSSAAPQRSRADYLPEEENCEMEREIDSNLDEISSGLGRLKMMGLAMGDAIDQSNEQLGRIDRRTDQVHDRVQRTGAKLHQMARK